MLGWIHSLLYILPIALFLTIVLYFLRKKLSKNNKLLFPIYFLICLIVFSAASSIDSYLHPEGIGQEFDYLAEKTGVYDKYAGSVTYRTITGKETTVYVYYEPIASGKFSYPDGSTRISWTYNVRIQDAKQSPAHTVIHSGDCYYPTDNPDKVTYESYYPQFIQKQDILVASAVYFDLYHSFANVVSWDNAYTETP